MIRFNHNDSVTYSDSLNESTIYMIRFSRKDSLTNSDFLTPTGGFNLIFKVSFEKKNIYNFKRERYSTF